MNSLKRIAQDTYMRELCLQLSIVILHTYIVYRQYPQQLKAQDKPWIQYYGTRKIEKYLECLSKNYK
jgi:hypothetical protein